jgi:hypothetical protein
MESQLAITTFSLEEKLRAATRDATSASKKALEETRATLDAVSAASAKKLEDELRTLTVKTITRLMQEKDDSLKQV